MGPKRTKEEELLEVSKAVRSSSANFAGIDYDEVIKYAQENSISITEAVGCFEIAEVLEGERRWKCDDDCLFLRGYDLKQNECRAGTYFAYCGMDRWDSSAASEDVEEARQRALSNPWADCPDYRKK